MSIPSLCDTGHRRGFMFVLSSPSGAGKTTLSRRLLTSHLGLTLSISVTTRPIRPLEIDGKDYFFINDETFSIMATENKLLEHATVFDYKYGTPKEHVSVSLDRGLDVLFDIDWQGTRQLASNCREDLVSVFILPPSMSELERRLRTRAQDSDEVVQKRMSKAEAEISHWAEYDYVVVNTDIDSTLSRIIHILEAERTKRSRQTNLPSFIETLCRR